MNTWRVSITSINTKTNRVEKEYCVMPAPTMSVAIEHCQWVDKLYPPIPPFTDVVRTYECREATASEKSAYYSNLEWDAL